jgi:signal transduction histidine kinase
VGPSSWDEANRAWTEVARKHKSLMEWIQTGELFESRDSEINAMARRIRVRIDPEEGVLAKTALEKRSFNVLDAATDPLVTTQLRETLKVDSFATVPLVAKGRAIGAIVVDNLFTRRPITEHDIRFLTMFAHQAALAIDNAIIHSNMETMNRDIRVMHEQLAQSEKMAALGVMMAEITHEIRNPLVSIGGFTRRLARKVTDPEARRYIDIIMSEVGRLEGIIHDNLAYIKNVGPQFSRTPLNNVIEEVLLVYEDELLQHGIRIERDLSPEVPDLELDPQQIKQAVVNLVANAMDAMEKGGVLMVKTSRSADSPEAVMEIGDTGPGISSDSMHNLFNPYFTTKVRGTGLGLPITHRIIQAHKGSIVFRNKETGGAVFTIRLPIPQEKK